MDEVGTDGRLRHVVPMRTAMRVFLVICGLLVLGLTLNELWRGLWPPSLFSLFFLIIVVGAFSVGLPMIVAGLPAPKAASFSLNFRTRDNWALKAWRPSATRCRACASTMAAATAKGASWPAQC